MALALLNTALHGIETAVDRVVATTLGSPGGPSAAAETPPATAAAAIPPADGSSPWATAGDEVVAGVLSFLSVGDLVAASATQRYVRNLVAVRGSELWRAHLRREFPPAAAEAEAGGRHPLPAYLAERRRRVHLDAAQLRSKMDVYTHMHSFATAKRGLWEAPPTTVLYGLLSDLAWVDDERVARALSRRRYQAMHTMVLDGPNCIMDFKKRTGFAAPSTFLPVATCALQADQEDEVARLAPFDVELPGFMGFAVDLIRLRPEHEHLRRSVIYTVFREICVFESREKQREAEALLAAADSPRELHAVALDKYTEAEMDSVCPLLATRSMRPNFYDDLARTPAERLAALEGLEAATERALAVARMAYD